MSRHIGWNSGTTYAAPCSCHNEQLARSLTADGCLPTWPLALPITSRMQVDGGFEPGADVGPMISKDAKARAESIIQKSEF